MENTTKLIEILKEKNYTISFAESCTGGMLASSLVNVSGASSVFEFGFITYSKSSKFSLLDVKKETMEKYGVVSCETAREMAEGAAIKSNSNVAISVTGCAGPGKDSDGNEAGTICFGFYINGNIISEKALLKGSSRNEIRAAAVEYATERICFYLSKE